MSSSSPFVILCAKCNSIVSDSSCNISTSEDLQVFISDSCNFHANLFLETTNITIGKQIKLATGGSDEGSSYFDLSCSACQEVIGKVYISTTDVTDAYRNKSAISFSKVKTYVLGSCVLENTDSKSALGTIHGVQCTFLIFFLIS